MGFGEATYVQEILVPLSRGELIGAVAVSETEDTQDPSGSWNDRIPRRPRIRAERQE